MRVLLSPHLFAVGHRARLGVLCEHGLERRHRLQVTHPDHPDFRSWLGSLDELSRLEWDEALESGARDDGIEPSVFEIEVVNAASSNWELHCPKLTLKDALAVLDEKFKIVLEGDAEDRDFLRCMSMPEQYDNLCDFERTRRSLELVLGGGLRSMIKRAEQDKTIPWARFRRWYLFDRDGLRPGEQSDQSEKLKELCEECGLPYCQLERRMIENYLPLNTLRAWAYGLAPRSRKKQVRLLEAFINMGTFEGTSVPRRHYFNMKTGFSRKRDAQARDKIFEDLTSAQKEALHDGFGPGIAKLFGNKARREDLQKDAGWDEVNPKIAYLLALIR